MRTRNTLSAAVSVAAIVTLIAPPLPASAGAAPLAGAAVAGPTQGRRAASASPAGQSYSVTLVTGDRVHVTPRANGQVTTQVLPGPGRERMAFRTYASGSRIEVVPADAARLVAADLVDARLFDVARLARLGYDDAHTDTMPVILSHSGVRPSSAAPQGVADARPLPSIGAEAVQERKSEASGFWRWLTGGAGPEARTLTAGVAKVWLDGQSRLVDDESNPQIGVPAAWQAGYRGTGVTVAVLDTGYDAAHPDLSGVVTGAKDFTGDPDGTADGHGHGTHVASIVAGSGAASAGRYAGVAPEAKLLVGKVCNDRGLCPDSSVIAGMEWAAASGVRVANLSLGGEPTDGTDPLSTALNRLTESSGTLFVVAAGNEGTAASIGAPGSADAALTVGSVDKADALSSFSSQGPRLGDFAVKPDLTAPGGAIVAARAAGTGMGIPVDERYTRASGTSMATPHATGAAALLAQAHPDWRAGALKAALTSAAAPRTGLSVYAQGAGRLDVGRAVAQRVYATSGNVDFGLLRWPYRDRPETGKTVTYRNDGESDVTLDLSLTATSPDGTAAPAALLRLGASSLVVPAHGTASVPVTLAPSAVGAHGNYSARLTATTADGATAVQTPIGVTAEAESYDLTITLLDRSGHAPAVDADQFVAINDSDVFGDATEPTFVNGRATVRLPRSHYEVTGWITAPAGGRDSSTLVDVTPFALEADRAITLDARAGRKLSFVTDRPVAPELRAFELVLTTGDGGGHQFLFGTFGEEDLYAVPVRSMMPERFTFAVQAVLVQPKPPAPPATAVAYNLAVPTPGRIPDRLTYHARHRELGAVHSRFYVQGQPADGSRTTLGSYGQPIVFGFFVDMPVPLRRVEYFSPSPVEWSRSVLLRAPGTPQFGFDGMVMNNYAAYEAGKSYREDWNRPVYGPQLATPEFYFWGVSRTGDSIRADVWMRAPNEPGHGNSGILDGFYSTGRTVLSRDGTVIGTSPFVGGGSFRVPADPGRYELAMDIDHKSTWSALSPRVSSTWSFSSANTAEPTVLPLLSARATGPFDDFGRAPDRSLFPLEIRVAPQHGAPAATISDVTVEVSDDDGVTWRRACLLVEAGGGRWLALVRHNDAGTGTGFVSLRLAAADDAGNTVRTTVIRAYRLVERG
ncbi:MAG TPA: S8 family serine peptidase [Pilimelia sp.]|nr:S8 family serine peptidase [Pilimelia sp.]